MLRLEPERRAKAGELIHHAWLDGIVVQGELEQIWAAEETDSRGKENIGAIIKGPPGASSRSRIPLADVDAMKPADDPEDTLIREQEEREREAFMRERANAAKFAKESSSGGGGGGGPTKKKPKKGKK